MTDFKKIPTVNATEVSLDGHGHPAFPQDIPDPKLWLDASRITGLADGAGVATWPDASGNGLHATQATAGARPLYKTGIINGLPVVRGDGVDDYLATAASALLDFSGTNGFTYAIVLRVPSGGGRGIFGKATAAFDAGYDFGSFSSGDQQLALRGSSLLFSGSGHGGDIRDGVPRMLTGWVDADEIHMLTNGIGFRDVAGTWTSTAASAAGFTVFTRETTGGGGSQFGQLDIAELALFGVILTLAQQRKLETYLATKYAIAVVGLTTFASLVKWGTD